MIVPPLVARLPVIVPIPLSVPPLRSNEWPAASVNCAAHEGRGPCGLDVIVCPTYGERAACADGDRAGIGEAGRRRGQVRAVLDRETSAVGREEPAQDVVAAAIGDFCRGPVQQDGRGVGRDDMPLPSCWPGKAGSCPEKAL